MAERLLSMHKVLGSTPSTPSKTEYAHIITSPIKKKKKKNTHTEGRTGGGGGGRVKLRVRG